ncbi:MAG: 2-oxo acid dehydrogenase subunit E2 [Candidatus Micrarchaeota archaeon]|nr:2-oxo acid dehydrogenase subunit E2 [Candidatus Micrarchaeota archaeon]MDE1823678.1 2-oxo acid dehydrogenase subunit E2 [Candidatus Micrarchaeota archaeon]
MKELRFVDVGEGITEGHVQKWLVSNGAMVKEDEPILHIETDKAIVDIPTPISGQIKIMVPDDSIVHVGDIMAYIGTPEELASIKEGQAQQEVHGEPIQKEELHYDVQEHKAPVEPAAANAKMLPTNEIIATPNVRKLAREMGIDLAKVKGSGPNGRILESDLQKGQHAAQAAGQVQPQRQLKGDEERVPMSQVRRAIAKNMELSAAIPSAAHMDIINATNLYRIVKKEKANAEQLKVKLTFLPFIIKATVEALKEYPRFNSSYDKEKQEVVLKKYYNIGLAAQGDDGLRVVVIKDADKKKILEIAREIEALHQKIVDKAITIDDMRDSTFTITNIGSLKGGFFSVPMINPPEVAILGVHLIRDWPLITEDQVIKIGKILPFSLVFDHRVVDGADAVLFGNALIKYLEDPEFLEML